MRIFCSYDIQNTRKWKLEESYSRKNPFSNENIIVEKGFIWDGASVPRILWWLVPKWGKFSGASLVHDWIYANNLKDRKTADKIFKELMKEDGVTEIQANMMYIAVRLFGKGVYNKD